MRALDGSADALVAVFTVFPAFYHIWVTCHNPYHLALMVPALGLAIVHLAVYDFDKESYLRGARPDQGGEGHDADAWRLSQLLQSDDQTAEIYRDENVWPLRLWALASLAPHTPSPRDSVATQP